MKINLKVNGKDTDVEIEPNDTLAEVLRERLQLTGTKTGCEEGECGACTVLMNGKPILSCLTLAIEAAGNDILTIEGLSNSENGKLHPIQEAFIENYAPQCGFCTSGMIMVAKSLLDENPDPSVEEIRRAISGNLCRCGNYQFIIKAVRSAAKKTGKGC